MVMDIAAQLGWSTRKFYFLNTFVQATLKWEVYVEMPAMFSEKTQTVKKQLF